jgi:hypothetical protein
MNEPLLYQRWQALFHEYVEKYKGKFDPHPVFEHSLPSFISSGLQVIERMDTLERGLSRLDGLPDLPEGATWPQVDGRALDFVAQINLEELEKGFHPSLPRKGWLYFFVGDWVNQVILPHRVLYFDGPVTHLMRTAPPPALKAPVQVGEHTAVVQFSPGFILDPDFYWQVFFNNLQKKTPPGFPTELPPEDLIQPETTRIGGYGYGFQGGKSDQDARLYLNGFPAIVEFGLLNPIPMGHDPDKRDKYIQEKNEWIARAGKQAQVEQEGRRFNEIKETIEQQLAPVEMLFGLESAMNRSWGDAGFLQFFIRQDDLRKKNFTHTYCEVIST